MMYSTTTKQTQAWLRRAILMGACSGVLLGSAVAMAQEEGAEVKIDDDLPIDDGPVGFTDGLILHVEGAFQFSATETVDSGVLDADGNDVPRFLSEQAVSDDLQTQTGVFVGNLQLGTRGVGYRPLNTYVNASMGAYAVGAPDLNEVGGLYIPLEDEAIDGNEQPYSFTAQGVAGIFLHSAYAELDGFATSGVAKNLSMRAGRQSHWGFGSTTFDGITFNYDSDADADTRVSVALRAGQRAQVYGFTQEDPGIYGGATLAIDFGSVGLKAEYALFTRDITLTERDIERFAGQDAELADGVDTFTLNLAELQFFIDPTDDIFIGLSGRLTDTAFTQANLDLRWAFTEDVGLWVDFTQRIDTGLPYDMIAGRGILVTDQRTGFRRTSNYEAMRLNFPDRQPYSDIQVQVPLRAANGLLDIVPRGGAHIVLGEDEELSPFDTTYFNFGLGFALHQQISKKAKLEVQLDYDGTVYDRTAVVGGENAGLMSDVRASPEDVVHRVYLGARYDRGSRYGGRVGQVYNRYMSLGIGGFLNLYQMNLRPYINTVLEEAVENQDLEDLDNNDLDNLAFNQGVLGFEVYGKYWFTDFTAARASFELADEFADEGVNGNELLFLPHLGAFTAFQLSLEGRF